MADKLTANLEAVARRTAALHAASWYATYRGILADDYLDHGLLASRRRYWRRRVLELSAREGDIFMLDIGGRDAGFVCVEIGPEPEWGALVNNLHVLPAWQGGGFGARLLETAAQWAVAHGRRQMYLWVYAGNRPARAFYEHLGWREMQRCLETVPGGGRRVALRMVKDL